MSYPYTYSFVVGNYIARVVLELNEPTAYAWKHKDHTLQEVIRNAFEQWEPYQSGRIPEGTKGHFFATSFEEQIKTTWMIHEESITWRQLLLSLVGSAPQVIFPDLPRFTVLEINLASCRDPILYQRQVRSG